MDKNELVELYKNPFYDDVFSAIDIPIPSKQIDYKINVAGKPEAKPNTKSVKEFELWMKNEYFEYRNPKWPFKGELFAYITILLTKRDYNSKDIDNIAKAMLDAMKGIVYEDDVQINTLLIRKNIQEKSGFMVAIKILDDNINKVPIDVPTPLSKYPNFF